MAVMPRPAPGAFHELAPGQAPPLWVTSSPPLVGRVVLLLPSPNAIGDLIIIGSTSSRLQADR